MRRIDRYLAWEILLPFVAALAFLFGLLFAMQLLKGIDVMFGSGVRGGDLLLIAAYLAPHFLVVAMPISFLLAVVMGVGRWAEDRETVALAASGVPLWRLWIAPALLGLLVSLAGVGLTHGPEPRSLTALKLHVNELVKRNMAGDVKPGVFYNALNDMTLYAQGVAPQTRQFTNLLISDERDERAAMLVLAHGGLVDPHGGGSGLGMLLSDGEIHRSDATGGNYAVVTFQDATLNIGVDRDILRKNKFGSATNEDLTPEELEEGAQLARARGDERDARRLEVARARRVASPFASLAFALCGVPLALGRKRGARTVGALAAMAGFVSYYVVARGGELLCDGGHLSPLLAAHLPNLLFAFMALWLMWRAARVER